MAAEGRRVVFDAEHFFDGYRADRGYALAVLDAAVDAGADTLALCDTNGGTLPDDVARDRATRSTGRARARVGVHFHNDAACAVANSVVAVSRRRACTCRARPTATASGAATPTCSRSSRAWS